MESTEKIQRLPFFPAPSKTVQSQEVRNYPETIKRGLDIILAILLLPFVLPFLLLLIFLIKIDSKGPAIYLSERIGKGGMKFACFKLRTMCLNADEQLSAILASDPILRMEWEKDQKLKKDPRVTRVGRILRALSLDELPQFFNVLKGEMSFVGPRPIVESEIIKYGKNYRYYKKVRPGITGMWQINGRNDTTYDHRVQLDKIYATNSNFILDLKIILKTIPAILSKKGAY